MDKAILRDDQGTVLMNLDDITPEKIVDKFNKWVNRTICGVLREHRETGRFIESVFNMRERPESMYETKVYLEALDMTLPNEESIVGMNWYLKLRKDIKKWKGIFEELTSEDYSDMTIEELADYMIADPNKVNELMSILSYLEVPYED